MAQERQRGRLIAAIGLALHPAFEPSDQRRLQSLTLDANTARSAGNYSQAEVLYLTAIREAERRPELASHLHCARGGLALVYQAQARYAEAERAELWPNRGPMACTARRVARFYASPSSPRTPTHDSGPLWIASPSTYETFIHNTLPVLPAHRNPKPQTRLFESL